MILINRDRINREIIGHLDKVYDNESYKSYEKVFTYYQKGEGYKITIPFEIENSTHTRIEFEDNYILVEHKGKDEHFEIKEGSTVLETMFDEFIERYEKENNLDAYKHYDIDSMSGGRDDY